VKTKELEHSLSLPDEVLVTQIPIHPHHMSNEIRMKPDYISEVAIFQTAEFIKIVGFSRSL
jgi:hypothetical protein